MTRLSLSLRRTFLAGLAFLIPLAATGWLLVFIYRLVERMSWPLMNFLLPDGMEPPRMLVSLCGILLVILLILGFGLVARNGIGKRLLEAVDQFFLGIPVVAFVYRGLKQGIQSAQALGGAQRFQRVVYVEYPAPGCRLIGFVTGRYHDEQIQKPVTSVFVPTSPNPMTGFVIVVEDTKVLDSTLSLEEASKLVFSAGLITPHPPPSAIASHD